MTLSRKSKMVSFRVSPEEYRRLREACGHSGINSVSELARSAVNALLTAPPPNPSLDHQLYDLRERVRVLNSEVERLAEIVDMTRRPNGLSVHAGRSSD